MFEQNVRSHVLVQLLETIVTQLVLTDRRDARTSALGSAAIVTQI
jgi:hypothetical protein